MEEEKRMMDGNPPIRHVTRHTWKDGRRCFIYINLSPRQPTFHKLPYVIIIGGWHHLCWLMAMNVSMVNPTWRRSERSSLCASLGYFQEVGSFVRNVLFFFSFFFLIASCDKHGKNRAMKCLAGYNPDQTLFLTCHRLKWTGLPSLH